ncbi:MAG TPA: hypothetical protein VMB03_16285 [Bryobacteraceae bacterium]|nr:hypothetical protein [Bryobacteraceae bacterium]
MRKTFIGSAILFSVLALVAQAQTPTFTAASVQNYASMAAGPIAPGMVVAITGSNLGDPNFPGNCITTVPVPVTCTAVSVLVNGSSVPKIFDSASEVTFQAPFNLSGSTATVQVTSTLSGHSLSSATVTVPVAAISPGVFSAGGTGSGTGYYLDSTGLFAMYSKPVQPGDAIVLFGTGFGATNPAVATGALAGSSGAAAAAPVTLTINNQSVQVTYAGLEPGSQTGAVIGYDEVTFTVPSNLTVPAGQTQASFPMVVTVGGMASNTVNLLVAAAPLSIASISPDPIGVSASPQTVTVNGTGFDQNVTLTIEGPPPSTQKSQASNITFINSTQFTAQITVSTAGTWSAVVDDAGSESSVFSFTASTSVSPNGPTISKIVTTWGNQPSSALEISQNAWVEVHGTNLAPAGTSTTWSQVGWDFSKGLPTSVANVSATVDNKPAAVYYVSPTQVNILSPLDSATGSVSVQLSTPNGTTSMTATTEVQASPAFLVFDVAGHVAAEHVPSLSLLGPTSLDAPGYTFTPASPGESITIYGTGFGQTNPAFTNQLSNLGPYPLNLPGLPSITIGNLPATVSFAGLIGPGLYQINLTVPSSAPSGDLPIVAMYNGASTQSTAVITVQ